SFIFVCIIHVHTPCNLIYTATLKACMLDLIISGEALFYPGHCQQWTSQPLPFTTTAPVNPSAGLTSHIDHPGPSCAPPNIVDESSDFSSASAASNSHKGYDRPSPTAFINASFRVHQLKNVSL